MNNKKKKESRETFDYITHKPEPIKFLTKKDMKIVDDHYEIIGALRKKSMTVKDIRELFYDRDKKEYSYTIKTIYRHIEKLQKYELVQEVGYRITKGTRLCEKLYSRTANLFFQEFIESESEWWNTEEGKKYAENLAIILGELFQVTKFDKYCYHDVFKQFYEQKYKVTVELLEKIKDNEKIANIYSNIHIDKVNKLNETITILVALLREPKLFEYLQHLFTKKK